MIHRLASEQTNGMGRELNELSCCLSGRRIRVREGEGLRRDALWQIKKKKHTHIKTYHACDFKVHM